MSKEKEAKGTFQFDGDSKRYHRFAFQGDDGIVGNLYIPKGQDIPDRIVLTNVKAAGV